MMNDNSFNISELINNQSLAVFEVADDSLITIEIHV